VIISVGLYLLAGWLETKVLRRMGMAQRE
jgi:hypothetical protein